MQIVAPHKKLWQATSRIRAADKEEAVAAKSAPAALWALVLGLILCWPAPACAIQIHGAPEGLYVHMMAHVYFSAALIFLLYILRYHPIGTGRAWTYLSLSLFFFLLWNIDTFVVHWLSIRLPAGAISETGPLWQHRLVPPLSLERWVYYVGRFDHVFSLPAMIFLILSLRTFCQEAGQSHAPPPPPR